MKLCRILCECHFLDFDTKPGVFRYLDDDVADALSEEGRADVSAKPTKEQVLEADAVLNDYKERKQKAEAEDKKHDEAEIEAGKRADVEAKKREKAVEKSAEDR